MSEIEKMYENANIKPEYRYDCNLADTIKPVNVFPLRCCSKGEIKDYCTNKQYYRYCKVYKVNKIYPPFTAEKQLELICWLVNNKDSIMITNKPKPVNLEVLKESIAYGINLLWQDLSEQERTEIKRILE